MAVCFDMKVCAAPSRRSSSGVDLGSRYRGSFAIAWLSWWIS
jgi:hypothetical protein